MRYEDMPKGRNKDRCVRCGKRYNFADKALSKAKVPYDLLCLAEVTASGYMTHGNVKLCDECMAELLMWLDRKTENSSEKPNNSTISKMEQVEDEPQTCDDCIWSVCNYNKAFEDEPQTYRINPKEPTNMPKCFDCEDFFTCDGQCDEVEDEPQIGEMMTEEEFDSMLARVLTGNNEPQTERNK